MKKIVLIFLLNTLIFIPKINALEITDVSDNISVEQGELVELEVKVKNETREKLTYQWYKSKTNKKNDFEKIPDAINSSYTMFAYELGNTYYYCGVSDGAEKLSSKTIAVKINKVNVEKPTIIHEPDDIDVGPNAYAVLNISAKVTDGGLVSYAWYKKSDGQFIELVDSNIPQYVLDTTIEGEFEYYCRITNTKYSVANSIDSKIIKVVVAKEYNKAAKPIIRTQPKSVKKMANTVDIVLSVEADSSDEGIISYQWYSGNTNKIADMKLIEGANKATYVVKNQDGIKYYTVLVTNKNGDATEQIYSDIVTIEIVADNTNNKKVLAICITVFVLSLVTYTLTIKKDRKKKMSN